uniref:Peroxisomal coenzyme A diphosphatase NUDT7-like n=1 Tax=Phallusia mammillata TaxID=59560 RepID=A0A6F9DNE2_9ASCI|nr:peroxisomal coenzyme A diphosphatase NUDT7-like [Phallusia mammillata]
MHSNSILTEEKLKQFKENLERQTYAHQDFIDRLDPEKIGFKRAAVLIALFEYQNEVFVILTKRSEQLKIHSGHVSLPGGKCDKTDADDIETALRESEEEIGLDKSHLTVLGKGFPFMSFHGIYITPVVAVIKNTHGITLKINKSEVDSAFACPLKYFINPDNHTIKMRTHSYNYTVPISNSNHQNPFLVELLKSPSGKTFHVWGVTAHILVPVVCLFYQASVTLGSSHYNSNDVFHQTREHLTSRSYFKNLFPQMSKL